jgi:hypothetical protein
VTSSPVACLRSKADDDYADFFLGRATPRMDGQPVRSGYWFGLEVARRIAAGKDLRTMASVRPSALLGEMETQLQRLAARREHLRKRNGAAADARAVVDELRVLRDRHRQRIIARHVGFQERRAILYVDCHRVARQRRVSE